MICSIMQGLLAGLLMTQGFACMITLALKEPSERFRVNTCHVSLLGRLFFAPRPRRRLVPGGVMLLRCFPFFTPASSPASTQPRVRKEKRQEKKHQEPVNASDPSADCSGSICPTLNGTSSLGHGHRSRVMTILQLLMMLMTMPAMA